MLLLVLAGLLKTYHAKNEYLSIFGYGPRLSSVCEHHFAVGSRDLKLVLGRKEHLLLTLIPVTRWSKNIFLHLTLVSLALRDQPPFIAQLLSTIMWPCGVLPVWSSEGLEVLGSYFIPLVLKNWITDYILYTTFQVSKLHLDASIFYQAASLA